LDEGRFFDLGGFGREKDCGREKTAEGKRITKEKLLKGKEWLKRG
jgi:hypothetical protein